MNPKQLNLDQLQRHLQAYGLTAWLTLAKQRSELAHATPALMTLLRPAKPTLFEFFFSLFLTYLVIKHKPRQ